MGFLLKLSITLLQTPILTVFVNCSIISSPRVTDWGDWGEWENCPPSTYAVGFQLKVESKLGDDGDDTSLNGIKLFCNTNPHADNNSDSQISSSIGPWGDWQSKMRCNQSFLTGFRIRLEASCGSKCDDTAANNIDAFCDKERWKYGQGNDLGKWSQNQLCPGLEKICGIRTQVEKPQGSGDDTSLNNVDFKCCP